MGRTAILIRERPACDWRLARGVEELSGSPTDSESLSKSSKPRAIRAALSRVPLPPPELAPSPAPRLHLLTVRSILYIGTLFPQPRTAPCPHPRTSPPPCPRLNPARSAGSG